MQGEHTAHDGTSIHEGASFVPCCDRCQWIGPDHWTRQAAVRALAVHRLTAEHRENTR